MKELPYLITLINSIKDEICYSYINKIVVDKEHKEYKEMENIKGQKIIDVLRYGGYIHFQFSQDAMLIDLGEEGSFVLTESNTYKNSIIKLDTDKGNLFIVDEGSKNITKIIPIWKDFTTMPAVGYDPLTKQFNYNLFCQLLSENQTTVEKLITNPLLISGIGETYGAMILKRASVGKKMKTSEVNKTKAREIFDSIKQVLREASGNTEDEESEDFED